MQIYYIQYMRLYVFTWRINLLKRKLFDKFEKIQLRWKFHNAEVHDFG